MNDRRRGLGRGLGALIPSVRIDEQPRPEPGAPDRIEAGARADESGLGGPFAESRSADVDGLVDGGARFAELDPARITSNARQPRQVFDEASPMSRIGPDAPPFLLSHGTNDSLIPIEEARLFAQRLRAASHRPVLHAELLPRAQHAFDVVGTPRAAAAAEAVARFLGVVYGEYLGTR